MNRIYLLLPVLCALMGCWMPPSWQPPVGPSGFWSDNDSSALWIEYPDRNHSIVLFCPFSGNSRTKHTFNPQSRTFHYSGTVENSTGSSEELSYEITSDRPSILIINGTRYSLDYGTVFQVSDDRSITQLPFAGIKPHPEYMQELKKIFKHSHDAQE